jgi:hypothetical protein
VTYTDALYAEPSLIEGVGRLVDLGALMKDYYYSLTPEQADLLTAARCDRTWRPPCDSLRMKSSITRNSVFCRVSGTGINKGMFLGSGQTR